MGRVRSARSWLRDKWRTVRDGIAVLEQLWAAALVTAVVTIALNLTVFGDDKPLGDRLAPAQGFIVAAVVSAGGYWSVRARRRNAGRLAGGAARALLNGRVDLGLDQRPTVGDAVEAARAHQLPTILRSGQECWHFADRMVERSAAFELSIRGCYGRASVTIQSMTDAVSTFFVPVVEEARALITISPTIVYAHNLDALSERATRYAPLEEALDALGRAAAELAARGDPAGSRADAKARADATAAEQVSQRDAFEQLAAKVRDRVAPVIRSEWLDPAAAAALCGRGLKDWEAIAAALIRARAEGLDGTNEPFAAAAQDVRDLVRKIMHADLPAGADECNVIIRALQASPTPARDAEAIAKEILDACEQFRKAISQLDQDIRGLERLAIAEH